MDPAGAISRREAESPMWGLGLVTMVFLVLYGMSNSGSKYR